MRRSLFVRCALALGVIATLYGSAETASAQTAVSLDGVDDFVSLPSGTIPDSNVTIAMWIKPTSYDINWPNLVFWGVQSGCFPSAQMFLIDENGKLSLFTGCEAGIRLIGATTVSLGVWQHVALTIDAAGNAVLYYNGAQDAAGNARGGAGVSTGNDLIGARWSGGVIGTGRFSDAVDEVQIYGRVLSSSEINALFNAGQGHCGAVTGGGLLAGYHFDEGSNTSAADFSGNGKTGSLINGAGWVSSPVATDCAEPATDPDAVMQTHINAVLVDLEALIAAPTTPPGSLNPLTRALTLSQKGLIFLAGGELGQGLDKIRDAVGQLRDAAKRGANTLALQQALTEAMQDRVEQAITDVSALASNGDPSIAGAQTLFDQGQNAVAVGNFLEAATSFVQSQKKLLGAVYSG